MYIQIVVNISSWTNSTVYNERMANKILYQTIKEFKMKSAQKISFNVNPYIVNGIIHQIAQLAQHAYLNFGDVTMVRIAPMVAMK